VGKGRRYLSHASTLTQGVLGGWRISGIQNYQSGYPLRVNSNLNTGLFSGQERANLIGGQPLMNPNYNGDPNIAPYINPAAFMRPAPFTFGNSGANLPWLRSPALLEEDLTLAKEFPLFREGQRLEFKASAFNIGNRVQFGGIDMTVEDNNFGRISSQANNPREIQLSLRAIF
jgi:hypothetical protein